MPYSLGAVERTSLPPSCAKQRVSGLSFDDESVGQGDTKGGWRAVVGPAIRISYSPKHRCLRISTSSFADVPFALCFIRAEKFARDPIGSVNCRSKNPPNPPLEKGGNVDPGEKCGVPD